MDETGDFGWTKNDILDNIFLVSLRMRYHLAGTIVWSKVALHCVRLGPDPHRKGRFGGRNPQFAAMPPIARLLWLFSVFLLGLLFHFMNAFVAEVFTQPSASSSASWSLSMRHLSTVITGVATLP